MKNLTNKTHALPGRQAATMVRQLDRRLLETAGESLDEQQKAVLLRWVHQHLLAPVIYLQQHAIQSASAENETNGGEMNSDDGKTFESDVTAWSDDGDGEAGGHAEALPFCFAGVEFVRQLLGGKALTKEVRAFWSIRPFQAGPGPKLEATDQPLMHAAAVETIAYELIRWFHRRLTHCAQRTRFHSDGELAALLAAAETQLLVCSLQWFDLRDHLGIKPLPEETLRAVGGAFFMAVQEKLGVTWTGTRLAFRQRSPALR